MYVTVYHACMSHKELGHPVKGCKRCHYKALVKPRAKESYMRVYFETNECERLETKELCGAYVWMGLVIGALALCLVGYVL